MKLDVHVKNRRVASLQRERDEYVLRYLPDAPESPLKVATTTTTGLVTGLTRGTNFGV